MTASSKDPKPTAGLTGLADPALWLSPRRKRFWFVAGILIYTVAGFFAVPTLVSHLLTTAARDDLGRDAAVGKVRFNPYVLSLEVNDFALRDVDGEVLAGFDQFFVNFQLSSVFRWAWTFREVRLDGLSLLFERFAPADTRLSRLLADFEQRSAPEQPAPPDSTGLPRMLIQDLSLGRGTIAFRDDVPQDPVALHLGPLTVSIQELNTLPDRSGRQSVHLLLPGGAAVSWQGSIELAPFRSEGQFALDRSGLEQTIAYLKAVLPLESMQAVLSVHTDYRIAEQADGSIDIELDSLNVDIDDVAISGLEPPAEIAAFNSLRLSGGTLRYPANELTFSSIRLSDPHLETWLNEDGSVNLLGFVPAATDDDAMAAPDAPQAADWRLAVDEFAVTGGHVGFQDRSIDPNATLALQDIELTVLEISNDEGAEFPVSLACKLVDGGSLGFEGRVSALPAVTAAGTATATGIPLALAQPYAQQQVNIRIGEGALDSETELQLRADGTLAAAGNLSIAGLRIDDTAAGQPLVGWQRLAVDRYETDTATRRLSLSLLDFRQPYGRLIINEDLTTNVSSLGNAPDQESPDPLSETAEEAVPEDGDAAAGAEELPAYAVVIGGIGVQDGSMDFADRSLPLPFATRIQKLGGTISTIDTQSAAPATIRLEGQVDDYGLARIRGDINLLDPIRKTDATMEFRNLLMSHLSPYSIEFAGQKIDEGKLDLDLHYGIADGQLQGQNAIVMTDLLLGDEVESPNAVSLPLGLAVALLKDSNGVIDIDLPVAGNVNDPEFKIGGVIWKAFVGLVTKIVAAPFRLLGSLIGIDSEDLGQFQFLAGRADLTPPELEKIRDLQRALQQRPELAIEISGPFDPAIDVPALQYARLREQVLARLGEADDAVDTELQMLDERIRSTLEGLFAERFPDTPLETLSAAHTAAPADDPEGKPVVDELAYTIDLRDRLLAAEPVGPAELAELAAARAETVQTAFLADGEIGEDRVRVTQPTEVKSEDGEWVATELGVAVE